MCLWCLVKAVDLLTKKNSLMSQGPGGIDSMKPSVDWFVEFFFLRPNIGKMHFM